MTKTYVEKLLCVFSYRCYGPQFLTFKSLIRFELNLVSVVGFPIPVILKLGSGCAVCLRCCKQVLSSWQQAGASL